MFWQKAIRKYISHLCWPCRCNFQTLFSAAKLSRSICSRSSLSLDRSRTLRPFPPLSSRKRAAGWRRPQRNCCPGQGCREARRSCSWLFRWAARPGSNIRWSRQGRLTDCSSTERPTIHTLVIDSMNSCGKILFTQPFEGRFWNNPSTSFARVAFCFVLLQEVVLELHELDSLAYTPLQRATPDSFRAYKIVFSPDVASNSIGGRDYIWWDSEKPTKTLWFHEDPQSTFASVDIVKTVKYFFSHFFPGCFCLGNRVFIVIFLCYTDLQASLCWGTLRTAAWSSSLPGSKTCVIIT